jgi:hypothetical protein
MNPESSNFQQKGKRKKNPNYPSGTYNQNKNYKKFSGSKQYGSPIVTSGQVRPRFQSDEGYNCNDTANYGDYFLTPPQSMAPYAFQEQTPPINQNMKALSAGFKNQKKFRSAIPNAGSLRPHKLNYCEDNLGYNQNQFNNYSGQYTSNQPYVQNAAMQFNGSEW